MPAKLAVKVAVWPRVMAPAVTEKPAVVAPALIVTVEGAVSADPAFCEIVTVAVLTAAEVKPTVQAALWPGPIELGVQVRNDSGELETRLIVEFWVLPLR